MGSHVTEGRIPSHKIVPLHGPSPIIELAVKGAVNTVNPVSHFRDLVDSIYNVYS